MEIIEFIDKYSNLIFLLNISGMIYWKIVLLFYKILLFHFTFVIYIHFFIIAKKCHYFPVKYF